ncbi:MAG: M48 family metallopeptidase [Thaumarchaeota archaeon]|nr:M48 family metallopeptidase [Nitrososphaerota archaeon]
MRGTSRRYTYFRFRSDRKLEVVLPTGRAVDVHSAIKSREAWILKHFQQLSANPRILDDEAVMYDGKMLSILFEKTEEKEEFLPDLEQKVVVVRASDRSRILELVRRWFVRETSRYVVRRLREISAGLPVKYKRADVREMKNWGYCTRNGRLSFSWQLIALPEPLRDYVVMHELAHLKVFNHSMAFKKRLAELCPDYRARERALNKIIPGSLADYLD